MAGVTDSTYRRLMAEHGAGMVATEMVSAEGLVRNQPATWRLCTQVPALSIPLAVQIFGHNPAVMAEAARLLESKGAAVIDINAGCPVRKVVKQGAGASLLRDADRLASVVEAVKGAVSAPVTVKMRLGWDETCKKPVETAKRLVSAGVDAITIHARTAAQHYSGFADWSWIGKVKRAVDVPVIGNGDVTDPALANRLLWETGCDAVMIGRGSLGNPWLFSSIASEWGCPVAGNPKPGWSDFHRVVTDHLDAVEREKSRPAGFYRKILIWYSKGCPESSRLRSELASVGKLDGMLSLLDKWLEGIAKRNIPFLPSKLSAIGHAEVCGVE
jgi:tRNA-dihydrouridine synthase B